MDGTLRDWNVYKTPTNDLMRNRRAFYCLRRIRCEPMEEWFSRIQKCVRCCELPALCHDFLLIDRFVNGLNSTEVEFIQKTDNWTLKKLLAHLTQHTTVSERSEINSAEDEYITSNQILIKSEPVCLLHA